MARRTPVLVALLLPAVQAAREAARRSSCSRNLEQLMLSILQYEGAHGVYPPGTIDAQGPIRTRPQGYHHNWILQVLPYLEAEVTYQHVDRSVSVYHPNNNPVRRLQLPNLYCPSSVTARTVSSRPGSPAAAFSTRSARTIRTIMRHRSPHSGTRIPGY